MKKTLKSTIPRNAVILTEQNRSKLRNRRCLPHSPQHDQIMARQARNKAHEQRTTTTQWHRHPGVCKLLYSAASQLCVRSLTGNCTMSQALCRLAHPTRGPALLRSTKAGKLSDANTCTQACGMLARIHPDHCKAEGASRAIRRVANGDGRGTKRTYHGPDWKRIRVAKAKHPTVPANNLQQQQPQTPPELLRKIPILVCSKAPTWNQNHDSTRYKQIMDAAVNTRSQSMEPERTTINDFTFTAHLGPPNMPTTKFRLRHLLPSGPLATVPPSPHWTTTLAVLPPVQPVIDLCTTIDSERLFTYFASQLGHRPAELAFNYTAWKTLATGKSRGKNLHRARKGIYSLRSLIDFTKYSSLSTLVQAKQQTALLSRQRWLTLPEILATVPGIVLHHPLSTVLLDHNFQYPRSRVIQDTFMHACLGRGIAPLALQALLPPLMQKIATQKSNSNQPDIFQVASVCSGVSLGLQCMDALPHKWRLARFVERDPDVAMVHSRAWASHHPKHYSEATTPPPIDTPLEDILLISPDCSAWSSANKVFTKTFEYALQETTEIIAAQFKNGRTPAIVVFETSDGAIQRDRDIAAAFLIAALQHCGGTSYTWKANIICTAKDLGASTNRSRIFITGCREEIQYQPQTTSAPPTSPTDSPSDPSDPPTSPNSSSASSSTDPTWKPYP